MKIDYMTIYHIVYIVYLLEIVISFRNNNRYR